MVNKAVVMSATRDANADGTVGKGASWSDNAPSVDAEDGAGQINLGALTTTLTNNRYFFADLSDGQFVSCGTGCRELVVTTFTVPAYDRLRVALAWQSCMLEELGTATLNNDLDLALTCGSEFQACGGTWSSTTVTSEMELLERPACHLSRTCSIRIRIKNGVSLAGCGSTSTERVGVGWTFNP